VLTSLAKALSDTERAVCHIMTGAVMQPHVKVCGCGPAAAAAAGGRGAGGRGFGACQLAHGLLHLLPGCPSECPTLTDSHLSRYHPTAPACPSACPRLPAPACSALPAPACRPAATPPSSSPWDWRLPMPGAWCSASACTSTRGPAPSSSTPSNTRQPSRWVGGWVGGQVVAVAEMEAVVVGGQCGRCRMHMA
jgi:hypothetical protein